MTDPRPGVTAPVALAFGTIGFFALLIAGFGMLSLLTGAEVVAVPGLGPLPGAFAVALTAPMEPSAKARPMDTVSLVGLSSASRCQPASGAPARKRSRSMK